MKLSYILLIVFSLLNQGCSVIQEIAAPTTPSKPKETAFEEFELPYGKDYIYDRWVVIQKTATEEKSNKKQIVRPTGNWVPDTYGPFGYEGSANFHINPKNKITRSYGPTLEGFEYCTEACTIDIRLIEVSSRKTEVRIEYTNAGGDVQPFMDELSNALRYFLTQPSKAEK